MAVKLHRCGITWFKLDAHPCWKVEKALRDRGVDYEVVLEPTFPRGKRKAVKEHTGQETLPGDRDSRTAPGSARSRASSSSRSTTGSYD